MKNARTWFPLTGPVVPRGRAAAPKKAAPKKPPPIDPLTGPKQALAGFIVTMDDAFTLLPDGIVYIDQGCFVAVQDRAQPAPAGFSGVHVVETGGILFPGLIELHNHLSYNALPLWSVPKLFQHRDQWSTHKDYRPMISGPMTVIGQSRNSLGQAALLPALVRYVECKCLLGGVTTTQGVMLASNAGVQRFYRGLIRNVEQTDDPALLEAQGRIADVVAKDARKFLTRLEKEDSCFLLHLSEGVTDPAKPLSVARKHFLALEVKKDEWALNDTFCGIHAAGLLPEDFDILAQKKASMVWSPLSNLLLYGGTARVDAASKAHVTIGLGSDWSPTGSKNLLGELKVAWLYSQHMLNGLFKARDLVAMATRDAACILKWKGLLGTISAGARADILAIDGTGNPADDPYDALIHAKETAIRLVMINGVARYGVPALMGLLSPNDQTVKVGGQSRKLYLKQETSDPDVAVVSLSKATSQLRSALLNIATLAKEAEKPKAVAARKLALDATAKPVWSLALDEIQDRGEDIRPRLPFNGPSDFTGAKRAAVKVTAAAPPLSSILKPIQLDPLTVADDPGFLDSIELQPNLPEEVRSNLRALY
jgi:cytosine/adenosine deaminase-related metal-dependent hydrolase